MTPKTKFLALAACLLLASCFRPTGPGGPIESRVTFYPGGVAEPIVFEAVETATYRNRCTVWLQDGRAIDICGDWTIEPVDVP